MFAQYQLFDDVDRHAESLEGWGQRYDQIGSGAYRSVVKQATLDGMHIFQEASNVRVLQRGALPPDHTIFGMPLVGDGAFTFGGARVDRGSMVFARGGVPFELHSPDHMSFICVAVDPDMLQWIADEAGVNLDDRLFQRNVVDLPSAPCARAGAQIATLLERMLAEPDAFDDTRARLAVRSQFSEILVELLTYRGSAPSNRLTYTCQTDVVSRVHDYVTRHPQEPVDIMSLCAQLRVSRRTLQNSFQSVVQTAPLTYVRSLRLAQVRRLLLDTRQADLSVGDAAARWGFVNLGYFASVYESQFGELPSKTPRKSARIAPARARTSPL
ncbi:helix-turn-helix domain-containing protein [Burkholderia sp. Ac-20353]|uniref:helix-turn-helix domain-containing protein n=1 Tax=Burkholderia sp. Ac-20353 TaxID=2703894 RepID=UPI00197BFFBE|nr:helix-turn-helix domain-containing protein [Burkholderia sp. Ac-20353]